MRARTHVGYKYNYKYTGLATYIYKATILVDTFQLSITITNFRRDDESQTTSNFSLSCVLQQIFFAIFLASAYNT